jgi:phosphatidylserine decarboxylase
MELVAPSLETDRQGVFSRVVTVGTALAVGSIVLAVKRGNAVRPLLWKGGINAGQHGAFLDPVGRTSATGT